MPDDPTDDTPIVRYTNLTYNGRGQCTGFTTLWTPEALQTLDGDCTFTYDGKGQLVTEALPDITETFAYDAAGNPTTFRGETRGYNVNNQWDDNGRTYDADGNPTARDGAALAFDPDGHLVGYGAQTAYAGYTLDGRRAWKATGESTTTYGYSGDQLVTEMRDGVVTAADAWEPTGKCCRIFQSAGLTPTAMTRMRTSLAPGCGSGASS